MLPCGRFPLARARGSWFSLARSGGGRFPASPRPDLMNSTGRFLFLGLALIIWFWRSSGVTGCLEAAPPQATLAPVVPAPAPGLAWDAVAKEYTSQPNERFAQFTFWFTNTASGEVL